MQGSHRILALLAVLLLLAGCGVQPAAEPTGDAPVAEPAGDAPIFVETECPLDLPDNATGYCGALIVPEDRSVPAGPQVELAVVVLSSPTNEPAPDPIFYLEGGPGGTALSDLEVWGDMGFLDTHEVVLLAQRGTDFTTPSLNCTEVDDETYADQVAALAACHDRLLADGIDLAAYTSATNAADVADLRQALGYEQINVLGLSYGTRLALTLLRDHPGHIRSVVLDSAYPPQVDGPAEDLTNLQRSLQRMFRDCAASPDCATAYPDLEAVFYGLIDDLNAAPVDVPVVDPETGEEFDQTVTGDDVIDAVYSAFYGTETIPLIPAMIAQATAGDFDLLLELGAEGAHAPRRGQEDEAADAALTMDGDSEGMHYSVQCAEEVPFTRAATFEQALDAAPLALTDWAIAGFEEYQAVCAFWEAAPADQRENEPVRSTVPTLVLAGEYDVATPPEWGQAATEGLPNSRYYAFPGYGHGISLDGGCPTSITLAFFADPASEPDAQCLEAVTAPAFVVDE